jgi:hypothetical protein
MAISSYRYAETSGYDRSRSCHAGLLLGDDHKPDST